ncbi:hypothetical protein HDV57DRAFT_497309 [Trichoderma longibrachiatum]
MKLSGGQRTAREDTKQRRVSKPSRHAPLRDLLTSLLLIGSLHTHEHPELSNRADDELGRLANAKSILGMHPQPQQPSASLPTCALPTWRWCLESPITQRLDCHRSPPLEPPEMATLSRRRVTLVKKFQNLHDIACITTHTHRPEPLLGLSSERSRDSFQSVPPRKL